MLGPDRAILGYVSRFPGISAKRLADLLQLHPSTLSNAFRRLVEHGMLERREDPDDARRVRLHVTDTGRAVLSETSGTIDAVLDRVVAGCPDETLQAARDVLQRIAFELQAELQTAPPAKDEE